MKIHEQLEKLHTELFIEKKIIYKTIGVTKNTWSRYEKGKTHPKIDQVMKIIDVFNISADWLLFGKGYPYQNISEIREIKEKLLSIEKQLEEIKILQKRQ